MIIIIIIIIIRLRRNGWKKTCNPGLGTIFNGRNMQMKLIHCSIRHRCLCNYYKRLARTTAPANIIIAVVIGVAGVVNRKRVSPLIADTTTNDDPPALTPPALVLFVVLFFFVKDIVFIDIKSASICLSGPKLKQLKLGKIQ